MMLRTFTIDGYTPGDVDFGGRVDALPPDTRETFDRAVHNFARAVTDALSQPFGSLMVVGHSDRQDAPGMTHREAQASEAAASRARADSAWGWLHATISEQAGSELAGWEDGSAKVTSLVVSAGSGQLVHPDPVTEEQRLQNRRVEVHLSHFDLV
jgi:flagellar motor protein MotB